MQLFQFLYGAIGRLCSFDLKEFQRRFNSYMVRLEVFRRRTEEAS